MAKFYSEILEVSRDVSQEEIKKAYHKLAHKYHPDRGGDEAKMKEVNEAYATLRNPKKRGQYDQLGQTFDGAGASGFLEGVIFLCSNEEEQGLILIFRTLEGFLRFLMIFLVGIERERGKLKLEVVI